MLRNRITADVIDAIARLHDDLHAQQFCILHVGKRLALVQLTTQDQQNVVMMLDTNGDLSDPRWYPVYANRRDEGPVTPERIEAMKAKLAQREEWASKTGFRCDANNADLRCRVKVRYGDLVGDDFTTHSERKRYVLTEVRRSDGQHLYALPLDRDDLQPIVLHTPAKGRLTAGLIFEHLCDTVAHDEAAAKGHSP